MGQKERDWYVCAYVCQNNIYRLVASRLLTPNAVCLCLSLLNIHKELKREKSLCYKFIVYQTHVIASYVCSDASYVDPIGDLPERPKTAARRQDLEEDDFHDVELGNDMLPE